MTAPPPAGGFARSPMTCRRSSDEFLWQRDGPVARAGGAKAVSAEADAIILAALHDEPAAELHAMLRNTAQQLARFATGDGLATLARHGHTVDRTRISPGRSSGLRRCEAEPWHEAGAAMAQHSARQRGAGQRGRPAAAIAASGRQPGALPWRRCWHCWPTPQITGVLSAPHDRYQSRLMWLPPLVLLLSLPRVSAR